MIKRMFVWDSTEAKVKSLVVWFFLTFSVPGMWSVYRWLTWLVSPAESHWYLSKGWLYAVSTLNVAMIFALMVQILVVFMLKEHYRGRKEVIREEIIRERGMDDKQEKFPFSHFDEVEPEDNEDYHAKRKEEMITASELLHILHTRRPESVTECNALLADPGVKKVEEAKLFLLNLRKKLRRKEERVHVFD